jgi:bifunctional non-homologous end joining protein LigD
MPHRDATRARPRVVALERGAVPSVVGVGSASPSRVTNPDKVLYPATGFTKADVIAYYLRVAPAIVPHLRHRPITLKRYPDGVGGAFFYEKHAPTHTPAWVQTGLVPRVAGGPPIRYVLVNDRRTLAWCANLASLELHPFLHRVSALTRPTSLVFDLDPGDGADVLACIAVAFDVKALLERLDLRVFAKVSGSKGLHLHVPLNTSTSYEVTQPFARAVAHTLERGHPRLITADMDKARRAKRVFIDWSQNAVHKTTVAVYSLRATRDGPFVSAPVEWAELERALARRDRDALAFRPADVLARVAQRGNVFRPVLTLKQRLPADFIRRVSSLP